jgi:hypothetical protein
LLQVIGFLENCSIHEPADDGSESAASGIVPKYMSANPMELSAVHGGLKKPAELEQPLPSERRKRARNHLHWSLLLFRNQAAEAVESLTRDLSSSGFYCVTDLAFTPGERLICTLKVPTHDPNGKHLEQRLECKVRVMRVEPQGAEGTFGLACQIEDYHFSQVQTERAQ